MLAGTDDSTEHGGVLLENSAIVENPENENVHGGVGSRFCRVEKETQSQLCWWKGEGSVRLCVNEYKWIESKRIELIITTFNVITQIKLNDWSVDRYSQASHQNSDKNNINSSIKIEWEIYVLLQQRAM